MSITDAEAETRERNINFIRNCLAAHLKNNELEKQNLLLKIANAELRDQLDSIITRLEQAFYDDHTSFWDVMTSIKKTLKKDSTNGKE